MLLLSTFPDDFDSETTQVGYIQPGHGTRGRQLWLASDGDIEEMYSQCQGKKEIHIQKCQWNFRSWPVNYIHEVIMKFILQLMIFII